VERKGRGLAFWAGFAAFSVLVLFAALLLLAIASDLLTGKTRDAYGVSTGKQHQSEIRIQKVHRD
jgi:hypothetical protein